MQFGSEPLDFVQFDSDLFVCLYVWFDWTFICVCNHAVSGDPCHSQIN